VGTPEPVETATTAGTPATPGNPPIRKLWNASSSRDINMQQEGWQRTGKNWNVTRRQQE
jgi:hypothetical protein